MRDRPIVWASLARSFHQRGAICRNCYEKGGILALLVAPLKIGVSHVVKIVANSLPAESAFVTGFVVAGLVAALSLLFVRRVKVRTTNVRTTEREVQA